MFASNSAESKWTETLQSPTLCRNLLISAVILLVTLGTIFVFSASFYEQGVRGDAFYFIRKQFLWIPIAVLSALVTLHFDYRLLARFYHWLLLLTFAMLALVLVPGVGLRINDSQRWLPVGSLQFQPSELAKLAAIIFVAGYFSQEPARLRRFWKGFVPVASVLLLMVVSIMVEPDYGTAMFLIGVVGLLLTLAGVRRLYLLSIAVVLIPVFAAAAVWRWELVKTRFLGFLDPEAIYQIRHSLLALGNGGPFGVGLGAGTQKLKFLPEPYTDFIFSIIGEELGYAGSLAVIFLFLLVLFAAVGIALRARDYFGFLVASGIAISLALQAATNIAVVTASAPTKGIPLPFLTFGGSGLCMTLAQMGILLSIDGVRTREGPLPSFSVEEMQGLQTKGTR